MKSMRKYLIGLLLALAEVVARGFAATFCIHHSESGAGVFRVQGDRSKTVHPDAEGAAVQILDGRGSTSCRAQLTALAYKVS